MDNKFYKAGVHQIDERGKYVESFASLKMFPDINSALEREKMFAFPMSIVEVREFNSPYCATLPFDSGKPVYRDISGILKALEKKFASFRDEKGSEGTMSYFLDCIKSRCFPDLVYLYDAVKLMNDEEVNKLLYEHGDSEYAKCVDGQIVSVTEPSAVRQALDTCDISTLAPVMCSYIVEANDENLTRGMFEKLAAKCLDPNTPAEFRQGLDFALETITGWNLEQLAQDALRLNDEKEYEPDEREDI